MVTEINCKLALDEYNAFFIVASVNHQTKCDGYVLIAEQRIIPDAIIRHFIASSDSKEELMLWADLRSISVENVITVDYSCKRLFMQRMTYG